MRGILLTAAVALALAGVAAAQTTGDANDPTGQQGTTGDVGDTGGAGTGDTGGGTQEAQGDGMNALWWIVPLLIVLGLAAWAVSRRRRTHGTTDRDRRV